MKNFNNQSTVNQFENKETIIIMVFGLVLYFFNLTIILNF